ncbi:stress protein, partial [Vibrio cidicii]|nr:stress protein [Vibrio cidicii]
MIRHLLLIKFKQSADSLEIEKLRCLFAAMPEKVD